MSDSKSPSEVATVRICRREAMPTPGADRSTVIYAEMLEAAQ